MTYSYDTRTRDYIIRLGNNIPRRMRAGVWQLDWEGKARVVGNEHPTRKPVELFAIPMRKHTLSGGICYEPFCGSGSQIIAGEQWGRVVYAMEISSVFVDVMVKRWGGRGFQDEALQ